MPSTFAADLATLMADAGTLAALRTYTSAYDPAAGQNVNTPHDTPVDAILSEYTVEEVAGGLVERGDLKATIPAASLSDAPTTAATFVLDGQEWSVVSVLPRYAGGVVLSYALQVRR